MTRQRYSVVEAVNRILNILKNTAVPQDTPDTVPGEILSVNQAVSDIAELMAGSLPGETFTIPDATLSNVSINTDQNIVTSADVNADDLQATTDVRVGQDLSVTGSIVCEDFTARDSVSARTVDGTSVTAGTGTFYAGFGRVSVGGISDPDSHGNGGIVLTFGEAAPAPTGTLDHLGGVMFVEGGVLKWLGCSGTITALAGS